MDKEKVEAAVYQLLAALGDDPDREGLLETPRRVADYYEEVLDGMKRDPAVHTQKVFRNADSDLVLVKDIPFHSTCEHHLLPFYGLGHIAYVPKDGQVIGLSKLARILEDWSLRLQIQERLTDSVGRTIMDNLKPQGLLVMLEAEHMCMSLRGIKKAGSRTVTKKTYGLVREDKDLEREILTMIKE